MGERIRLTNTVEELFDLRRWQVGIVLFGYDSQLENLRLFHVLFLCWGTISCGQPMCRAGFPASVGFLRSLQGIAVHDDSFVGIVDGRDQQLCGLGVGEGGLLAEEVPAFGAPLTRGVFWPPAKAFGSAIHSRTQYGTSFHFKHPSRWPANAPGNRFDCSGG